MTLFIDNDMSPALAATLRALGIDARALRECFSAGAPDTEWLPIAGERGWIVCTADRGITQAGGHLPIVRQHQIIVVRWPNSLPGDTPEQKRAWFARRVVELLPSLSSAIGPAIFRVDRSGRFLRWDWADAEWASL
jgi:predicted nuclease of predicted toxin-antitoxin system